MTGQQRGDLVLEKIPSSQIERKIINYLSKLRKGSSRKNLADKLKETPTVLFKDISMERGCMIAAELKTLGAVAFFVPQNPDENPEQEDPSSTAEEPSRSSTYKVTTLPKHKKRRWWKGALLIILVLILAAILAEQFMPFSLTDLFSKGPIPLSLLPATEPAPFLPDNARNPTVMEASPADLYNTFLRQYRLKPDRRFIKAFENLVNRFGNGRTESPSYKLGEILSNGKEISIPLLKEDRMIVKIDLPLPLSFPEVLRALDKWIVAMEGPDIKREPTPLPEDSLKTVETMDQEINRLDPRGIILALKTLEDLREKIGPDPRIYKTAAKAYALLLMILTPDPLDYSDNLAAEALTYLALARHLDPKGSLYWEEALLSLNMGYSAHAQAVLQYDPAVSNDPDKKKLAAFIRRDLSGLKALEGTGSRLWGKYLLVRLCRKMHMVDEAGSRATSFFEEFSSCYPALVELLYSGNLETAKALAVLYPQDIVAHLEQGYTGESIKNEKTWSERLRAFSKAPVTEPYSPTQFENLLGKWSPLGKAEDQRALIDDRRIKTVFRILYSGALYLRFNFYQSRGGAPVPSQGYGESTPAKPKDHPILLMMQIEVLNKTGRNKDLDTLCIRLINQNDTPASLINEAYAKVTEPMTQIALARTVAQKLDGRPKHLFFLGTVFQNLNNLDLAEKYFLQSLALNPYQFSGYSYLARLRGSDEPLSQALLKYPDQLSLLEEAGTYYSRKKDPASDEKALKAVEAALKLAPAKTGLYEEKVRILKHLNRFEEAAAVLRNWLKDFGRPDLTTAVFRASLADVYLAMKKPKIALDVVAKELSSNQGEAMLVALKAYEALGQRKQAEELVKKIVNRFPLMEGALSVTAAYYWRQGRDAEAAAVIALGRKNRGKSTLWYGKEFFDVFSQSTPERIINAVTLLNKGGQSVGEITELALQFELRRRPEVASQLLIQFPPTAFGGLIEHFVKTYATLKSWKGESEAAKYLKGVVTKDMTMPLIMILSNNGFYDPILTELSDPKAYLSGQGEFLWLQRLIAWLALGKKPSQLESELMNHYKENWLEKLSGGKESDQYHLIGQYLLGLISRQNLLGSIQNPKQRCRFSYYIGFSERLKGNFPEATTWYHICLETQFQTNEEFQKARAELYYWAQIGSKNRNRLLGDERKLAEKQGT